MSPEKNLKRTDSGDADFRQLIERLDHELWNELNEDQATYDQFNKVPDLKTALVGYAGEEPVACGCFKVIGPETIEIKRMFVAKTFRGQGWSKLILGGLEDWARELGYPKAVLETSIHFNTARTLYKSCGYQEIPNYGPYIGLPESVCMGKNL